MSESELSEDYVQIPIVHLLKHPEFFIEVSTYILLSGKYIRLNFAEDPFEQILNNLLKKGAHHVFLTRDDMVELLHNYQKKMVAQESQEFDEVVNRELQVSENETMIMLAQSFIKSFGLTPEVAQMVETSNRNVQAIISKSRNISSMLQNFRKNCSEEFFKIAFTNYICSLILNHFPWTTPQILEKLMLASTLCDLTLSPADFESIRAWEAGKAELTENARNHPLDVVNVLKDENNQVTLETITIIKQHHERPDGKGFPTGIDHNRINQLSAIFIIAQRYGDLVCEADPGSIDYVGIAQSLEDTYRGGQFTKNCRALIAEVNKIKG